MKHIGHVMILASAGSGKTYALTNRFVRLLARDAKPERIVALTFTRKGAGEFFDEILHKLAKAAAQPVAAAALAKAIDFPQLTTSDFLRMLRSVVDAMPRLKLGTFDGFFARIARNFPIELGLAGEFEILQEHASRRERSRVLQRMFQRAGELTGAQKEFIEAFKRATFGADEKQLGQRLDRFIDEHQEVFLSASAVEHWGNVDQIWPEGSEWFGATAAHVKVAERELRDWIKQAALAEKPRMRWDDFLVQLAAWSPGAEMPTEMKYVLVKALEAWPELSKGRATLEFFRQKAELDAAACAALTVLIRYIVGGEMNRKLEITRGIHSVLSSYESVYHDAVRRTGKLTFGDVQRLLAPEDERAGMLSRVAGDGRLFIDFRLDAEIDHWLLDEFQDTSFGQWSVLKNLVDEAVQDTTGERSFFYVGDVKQAIFAWREGDPGLFREIFDQYNSAAPGLIAEEHLTESYRSGPPIVAMVNQVFGDKAAISAMFQTSAAADWNREWREHLSAKSELGGHVALLHADEKEDRFRVTLELLLEIEPLERGLTCAVLVQKNDIAAELADYLRREGGLPAVAEADLHVCVDNPLGVALLALVKSAAYPGDSLAREHLLMTPFGRVLKERGWTEPDEFTRRVMGQIHSEGFERTMDTWIRTVEPEMANDDAFSHERGRQFTAAAGLFDATGSREVMEFVEFMERHTVRAADVSSAVRVMTIHKSKGLGFDLVVLPDLEGSKLESRRDGLAVQRAPDRSIEWVLDLPSKDLLSQDVVLRAHLNAAEAEGGYEKLSLLYVAMTRAKRAMYVITKPPGRSTSRNFPKLLAETLGEDDLVVPVGKLKFSGSYFLGDSGWFKALSLSANKEEQVPEIVPLEASKVRRVSRLPARRPSSQEKGVLAGAGFFALKEVESSLDFGREVHGLLAQVEWITTRDSSRWAKDWAGKGEAAELALACLRNPEFAHVWARQSYADVWRERTFEIVLDGVWVTGVFDRVVIDRDATGQANRATVYDFKTDRESRGMGERYAAQLGLYRRAAAQLAGLGSEAVAGELLLLRQGKRVAMAPQ